jgi:hypothetical protein
MSRFLRLHCNGAPKGLDPGGDPAAAMAKAVEQLPQRVLGLRFEMSQDVREQLPAGPTFRGIPIWVRPE